MWVAVGWVYAHPRMCEKFPGSLIGYPGNDVATRLLLFATWDRNGWGHKANR